MRERTNIQLWEITLPRKTNSGQPYDAAQQAYARWLCDTFGGFTRREVKGAWLNDEGQLFQDDSYVYSVMVDAPGNELLYEMGARLFPDQEAFFVTCVGQAQIVAYADAAKRWQ